MNLNYSQNGVCNMNRAIHIILALIFAVTGTVCAETLVEFTYPQDGDTVDMSETVEGASEDIPDGYTLWVVVYPYGVYRYHPQNYLINFMANGDWFAEAIVGSEIDQGLKFNLFAVLADETANREINDYFEQCERDQNWPGLEELPEGAVIYDRVNVMRN